MWRYFAFRHNKIPILASNSFTREKMLNTSGNGMQSNFSMHWNLLFHFSLGGLPDWWLLIVYTITGKSHKQFGDEILCCILSFMLFENRAINLVSPHEWDDNSEKDHPVKVKLMIQNRSWNLIYYLLMNIVFLYKTQSITWDRSFSTSSALKSLFIRSWTWSSSLNVEEWNPLFNLELNLLPNNSGIYSRLIVWITLLRVEYYFEHWFLLSNGVIPNDSKRVDFYSCTFIEYDVVCFDIM